VVLRAGEMGAFKYILKFCLHLKRKEVLIKDRQPCTLYQRSQKYKARISQYQHMVVTCL